MGEKMKFVCLWGVLIICIALTADAVTATANETDNNTFVATKEWKEIEEGQKIPKGLYVRLNLATGKKEAKLMNVDEDDSNDIFEDEKTVREKSITVRHGEVYEEEVPRLRSMKIGKKLEQNLKKLPKQLPPLTLDYMPEQIESIRKNYQEYEEIKKSFEEMKGEFRTDADLITRLINEYRNITKLTKFQGGEGMLAIQLQILQELDNFLNQFDNALWFIDSRGLDDILLPLIVNQTNVFLRIQAMRLLGSLTQNNPKAQVKVFEANFGAHLTQILMTSSNSEELSVALFALGALIRKFPYAQLKILSTSGSRALVYILSRDCDLKVKAKAAALISDLLMEYKLEMEHFDGDNILQWEQYLELSHNVWLQTYSFCDVLESVVAGSFYEFLDQADLTQPFIECLGSANFICSVIWEQSPLLRQPLTRLMKHYGNSASEYKQEVGLQIKEFLKTLNVHDEL